MVLEVISCTLVTAGVILFAWCLVGVFLLPVTGEDMVTQYRVSGSAEMLEQTVRSFTWLRETGMIDMPLQIIDCGLNEQGLLAVRRLAERHPYIQVVEESAPDTAEVGR